MWAHLRARAEALIVSSESGQTVLEYGLVVGFVSIVILGTLAASANGWITTVTGQITDVLS